MGTVALSVAQRAREFALLRAIGTTPRQIRRSVATEALLVAPLAGLVGCLPGIALAHWWFGQLKDKGAIPEAVGLSVSYVPLLVGRRHGAARRAGRRIRGRPPPGADQAGAGAHRGVGGAAAAGLDPYRRWGSRPRPEAASAPGSPPR